MSQHFAFIWGLLSGVALGMGIAYHHAAKVMHIAECNQCGWSLKKHEDAARDKL